MGRIVGIDYGEKRVGTAVSDDGLLYAFPRSVFPNDDKLLGALADLAEYEGADHFVLGASENPRGGENAIMRRITIFGEALRVRTGREVSFVNEVYTSAEARRALEEKVKTRRNTQVEVDASAAALILQTYLDGQRNVPSE